MWAQRHECGGHAPCSLATSLEFPSWAGTNVPQGPQRVLCTVGVSGADVQNATCRVPGQAGGRGTARWEEASALGPGCPDGVPVLPFTSWESSGELSAPLTLHLPPVQSGLSDVPASRVGELVSAQPPARRKLGVCLLSQMNQKSSVAVFWEDGGLGSQVASALVLKEGRRWPGWCWGGCPGRWRWACRDRAESFSSVQLAKGWAHLPPPPMSWRLRELLQQGSHPPAGVLRGPQPTPACSRAGS